MIRLARWILVVCAMALLPSLAVAVDIDLKQGGGGTTTLGGEGNAANVNIVSGTGSSLVTATATENAPTYTEGQTDAPLSLNLGAGLRVILENLLSGEDQVADLIMTGGAAVRQTLLASGITDDRTSAAGLIYAGPKTLYGQVVCSSGACAQTQAIYGDIDSDAANGVLLCTITLSATTRDQAACLTSTSPWSFYYIVTTATSGTAATGSVYAMY